MQKWKNPHEKKSFSKVTYETAIHCIKNLPAKVSLPLHIFSREDLGISLASEASLSHTDTCLHDKLHRQTTRAEHKLFLLLSLFTLFEKGRSRCFLRPLPTRYCAIRAFVDFKSHLSLFPSILKFVFQNGIIEGSPPPHPIHLLAVKSPVPLLAVML